MFPKTLVSTYESNPRTATSPIKKQHCNKSGFPLKVFRYFRLKILLNAVMQNKKCDLQIGMLVLDLPHLSLCFYVYYVGYIQHVFSHSLSLLQIDTISNQQKRLNTISTEKFQILKLKTAYDTWDTIFIEYSVLLDTVFR